MYSSGVSAMVRWISRVLSAASSMRTCRHIPLEDKHDSVSLKLRPSVDNVPDQRTNARPASGSSVSENNWQDSFRANFPMWQTIEMLRPQSRAALDALVKAACTQSAYDDMEIKEQAQIYSASQ